MPRPTPQEAVSILSEAGIQATSQDQDVIVTTGHLSGNLACLCVNGGAAAVASLDPGVLAILGTPATFQSNGCTQYFYQCSQFERTRQLTEAVTIHGEPDTLIVYPSPAWSHISGTFRKLPMISWADHCRMVELILRPPQKPEITAEIEELIFSGATPTEDKVALVFEAKYKGELRYCERWRKWLHWETDRWAPEHTLLAFHYSRSLARDVNVRVAPTPAKASFARGVEAFARASRTFATQAEDWDKNPSQFNTPSGTVNLDTGILSPHRKEDYLTKVTAVTPAAGAFPVFQRFLRDITLEDDALAGYLQRSLGACLSGAQREHFILFWYGPGRAGKNTLWDLVRWLMGGYAKTIPIETLLSRRDDRNKDTLYANLMGIRLAISSEIAEGAFFDEQKLKSLSGDATIPGRFLYGENFEFVRTHKHLIVGNERPQLRIVDKAIKQRLHVVPFKADFSDTSVCDLDMPAKLRKEGPQILTWLIEGHLLWLEDGYLKQPSAVEKETASYFQAQSTPDLWVLECCTEREGVGTAACDLYASFKTWKEGRGEGVVSQTRWAEWMNRYTKKRYGRGIVYEGIELKPTSVLDYRPNP